MGQLLNRIWRLLATGFCFACFGLGGVILSTLVFPVIRLASPGRSARLSRRIIRRTFGIFLRLLTYTGVIRFEITGAATLALDGGCLLIANHPTLIDYVVIASLIDNCDCVVKQKLWSNPFVRGAVTAAGYVPNRDAEEVMGRCRDSLADGSVLLIFPEGTRTSVDQPMKLQRGAANMALRFGTPIRIVRILCEPRTLAKEDRWYAVPRVRPVYRLHVGELLNVDGFVENAPNMSSAARRLTEYLQTQLSYGI